MSTISIERLDVNVYERQEVFEGLMGVLTEVSGEALSSLINGVLEDEVTDALGRAPGSPRQDSGEGLGPWACHRCGERRGRELKRNGHYPRQLQTTRGAVSLRVPMVRCTRCRSSRSWSP